MCLFGGIYHDLDVFSLKRLDTAQFEPHVRVVLGSNVYYPGVPHDDSVSNEVLLSQPGHHFWKLCLELATSVPMEKICGQQEMFHIAGFGMLGKCYREWHRRYPSRSGEVIVAPSDLFHPLTAALLYLNVQRAKENEKMFEEEGFIITSEIELSEQHRGFDICFLHRAIIHMVAAPAQRPLFLKLCPELQDLDSLPTQYEQLSKCTALLSQSCVKAARASDALTLTMATLSWANLCTDVIPPIHNILRCKRVMPQVALLVAVARSPQEMIEVARGVGLLSELCLLFFMRAHSYKTSDVDAKAYTAPANQCINSALQLGMELPDVIRKNIRQSEL
eukprot:TRINITY_DN55570_c0_g1_i1.p1 TRINITY_DN55570_c0_g1~~TRINITY_DN55570_c0_g1_i1.p1  ORF type:complete len:334 (+),score=20.44 TRINITY_DN55570_c0_g1_i1:459-1460(+)